MNQVELAVTVPLDDVEALNALRESLHAAPPMESRALDGETVLTAVLVVTLASVNMLRAWLLARSEERRGCVVRFDGKTFLGYSSDDVEAILAAIDSRLDQANDDGPG